MILGKRDETALLIRKTTTLIKKRSTIVYYLLNYSLIVGEAKGNLIHY